MNDSNSLLLKINEVSEKLIEHDELNSAQISTLGSELLDLFETFCNSLGNIDTAIINDIDSVKSDISCDSFDYTSNDNIHKIIQLIDAMNLILLRNPIFRSENLNGENESKVELEQNPDNDNACSAEPANEVLTMDHSEDIEFATEYLDEMSDLLQEIEIETIVLAKDYSNQEAIDTIFRNFHSIKGNAGIMEHNKLRVISHKIEDILDMVRSGDYQMQKCIIDMILSTNDILKNIIHNLSPEDMKEKISETEVETHINYIIDQQALISSEEKIVTDNIPITKEFINPKSIQKVKPSKSGSSTIRIDVNKLDSIIDIVSELIISSHSIFDSEIIKTNKDIAFRKNISNNAQIISQLQKSALSLRMVNLENTFKKIERIVFDYTKNSTKKIDLINIGSETEIDRNFVDEIYEAIVHIVRNCCDHGIEQTSNREKLGKNPVGKIELRAYHKGDNVVIEISDDGKGLDKNLILNKAKQKGIDIPPNVTDSYIYDLIMQPGFSTSTLVSNTSGRGVGMDVVKRSLTKLGGRIDIESKLNVGSKFKIILPLTLAIMEGLFVKVFNNFLTIPVSHIFKMLQPDSCNLSKIMGKGLLYKYNDKLYPVIDLAKLLNPELEKTKFDTGILILVNYLDKEFALLVDEIHEIRDFVVKSISLNNVDLSFFSGGTILSDGSVALIVNIAGIYDNLSTLTS